MRSGIKVNNFKGSYISNTSLLWSELLPAVFFLEVQLSGVERLLNETLDKQHYQYMSMLPFLHVHHIGQNDFAVKLLFEFSVVF